MRGKEGYCHLHKWTDDGLTKSAEPGRGVMGLIKTSCESPNAESYTEMLRREGHFHRRWPVNRHSLAGAWSEQIVLLSLRAMALGLGTEGACGPMHMPY